LLKEKGEQQKINVRSFYLRRMLRIFPLYYLIILLSFIFFFNSQTQFNYLPHLYFWGNFETIIDGKWIGGLLSPLWTICIEEHFYLVAPIVIALLPVRSVKYFFIAVITFSIFSKAYFSFSNASNFFIINCHTLSKMDVIAMGGLLACIYSEKRIKLDVSVFYLIALLILIAVLMSFVNFFDYSTASRAMFIKYLINIPFLIFFCLFIFNENKLVEQFKRNKGLEYLGSISYGIYMYHFVAIYFLQKIFFAESVSGKVVFVFLIAVITIAIAAVSYSYFEMPFLKIKKRFAVADESAK
jgi:peptidoglycan/LPS O-acetylase OafA/YrhL